MAEKPNKIKKGRHCLTTYVPNHLLKFYNRKEIPQRSQLIEDSLKVNEEKTQKRFLVHRLTQYFAEEFGDEIIFSKRKHNKNIFNLATKAYSKLNL